MESQRTRLIVHVAPGENWTYNCLCWIQAVETAQRIIRVVRINWHDLASLAYAEEPLLPYFPGEVVVLRSVPDREDLYGVAAQLLSFNYEGELGEWFVQPDVQVELAEDLSPIPASPLMVPSTSIERLPSMPMEGVSLACLREFCTEHRAVLLGLSTTEVCNGVVKPLTQSSGLSLAVSLRNACLKDENGRPFIGKATVFVSHAWSYDFFSLVSALEDFGSQQPDPEQVYFWIDLMVLPQHQRTGPGLRPSLWWKKTYVEAVGAIGLMCLVLSPWDNPIPLGRLWCLWEMVCSLQGSAKLVVQLMESETAAFNAALLEDYERVEGTMARIDIATAEANEKFLPDGLSTTYRDAILKAIGEIMGVQPANKVLGGFMRRWLLQRGRELLERLPMMNRGTSTLIHSLAISLRAVGNLPLAESLGAFALKARRQQLGSHHPDTLASMTNLALVLKAQGKHDEAEPVSLEALKIYKALNGNVSNLAKLLQSQGKVVEAEPLLREALDAKREVLGSANPVTFAAMEALAGLLHETGRLEEAEMLYREAVEGRRDSLGARHPETLTASHALVLVMHQGGKSEEAERWSRAVLNVRVEELGNRHPDTLASIASHGGLLREQGKLSEAEPLLRAALSLRRELLGPNHVDTLASVNNLAVALQELGSPEQLAEAEALFREDLAAQRRVQGSDRPETLIAINNLGGVLQQRGKTEEADTLFHEALRGCHEVLSKNPQAAIKDARYHELLLEFRQLEQAREELCRSGEADVLGSPFKSRPQTLDASRTPSKARRGVFSSFSPKKEPATPPSSTPRRG